MAGHVSLQYSTAPQHNQTQIQDSEPRWVRWFLIAIALAFIFLFLLLPLAAIFIKAFEKNKPNS